MDSLGGHGFTQSSGIAATSREQLEATITVQPSAQRAQVLSILREMPQLGPQKLYVDDKFLGITVIASPASNAWSDTAVELVIFQSSTLRAPGNSYMNMYSLVAVHGLGGHAANTWTNASTHFWPRDFLPKAFPDARVLSFGYESSIMSRSTAGIKDIAVQLLSSLSSYRDTKEVIIPITLSLLLADMALTVIL